MVLYGLGFSVPFPCSILGGLQRNAPCTLPIKDTVSELLYVISSITDIFCKSLLTLKEGNK